MRSSKDIIRKTQQYGAANYQPHEVVIESARGFLVKTPEGEEYYDMLSAYSALNFGHLHPELVEAAKQQLEKVTLTSRAFHSSLLGEFCEKLARLTGKELILPMNTGAEAVETAVKTARRWGVDVKGVAENRQEIIVCENNFHGRTVTVITMSSDPAARRGFGPYTPGFVQIPFGDAASLENAVTPHTAAFLFEPIQGEAGVIVPPEGYLKAVREICTRRKILMVADEVQTGLARTGKMFACMHEDVEPDIYILGKALGGGILPVSAVAADKDILGVYEPGSHGSTFGGNPLACAVALKAMEILVRDDYPAQAAEKGAYVLRELRAVANPDIKEVRGKGLLIGVEFKGPAAPYVERLKANGVLAKETHGTIIRLAPPVNIPADRLADAVRRVKKAFSPA